MIVIGLFWSSPKMPAVAPRALNPNLIGVAGFGGTRNKVTGLEPLRFGGTKPPTRSRSVLAEQSHRPEAIGFLAEQSHALIVTN
jgi:hypothetical protein